MLFTVPNSWGSPLREFNKCHEPGGKPAGGQFCSAPDSGGGGGSFQVEEGRQYYVRFGELPKSGYSTNFARGTFEGGASVYDAVGRKGRLVLQVPPEGEWADQDLRDRIKQEQEAYVVEGEYAGEGGDGEPLLRKARVVARVPSSILAVD
jgi:hypothetical protein